MPTSTPLRTSCELPHIELGVTSPISRPNCYRATVKCESGWPGLAKGKFPTTLPGLVMEKEGLESRVG